MEMIYTSRKDYHNKQQMNELLINLIWEEIVKAFSRKKIFKKWSNH